MPSRPSTIERAFELARSGAVRNIDELERRLRQEQHHDVVGNLQGASIRRDLRRLFKEYAEKHRLVHA